MHEMPIVMNVVRSMDQYAEQYHIPEIRVVVMELGQASSVQPFFFRSCWDPVIGQSRHLLNASLEIREIPCEAKCNSCGHTFHPAEFTAPCPNCNSNAWNVISGRDVRIKEIKV